MADDNIDVLLGSVAVAVKNVSLLDGTDVAKLMLATPLAFVVVINKRPTLSGAGGVPSGCQRVAQYIWYWAWRSVFQLSGPRVPWFAAA